LMAAAGLLGLWIQARVLKVSMEGRVAKVVNCRLAELPRAAGSIQDESEEKGDIGIAEKGTKLSSKWRDEQKVQSGQGETKGLADRPGAAERMGWVVVINDSALSAQRPPKQQRELGLSQQISPDRA
jgi:hypothetical protein